VTVFAQGRGGIVRDFVYDDTLTSSEANSLTVRSNRLTPDPVSIAALSGGFGTEGNHLFVVNANGTLAILTSERVQEVTAWTPRVSQGLAKSVTTSGGKVWVCYERDGLFSLEVMDETARMDNQSGTLTSGTPTDSWSIPHLAGKTVDVLADGHWVTVTVDGTGTLTLPFEASEITAGLSFVPLVSLMPFDVPGSPLRGSMMRVSRVTLDYEATAGLSINGIPVTTNLMSGTLDQPVALETGVRQVRLLGWSRDPGVVIRQDGPFGMNLRGVTCDLAANG
jgi:hypothetical protein